MSQLTIINTEMGFDCPRTCADHRDEVTTCDSCRFNEIFQAIGVAHPVNSQTIKVSVQIKDVAALKEAANRIGVVLDENAKTYRNYFTEDNPCAFAIRRKDGKGHEIGGIAEDDGTYSLKWDNDESKHTEKIGDIVGKQAEELKGAYIIEASIGAARSKGWGFLRTPSGVTINHPSKGRMMVSPDGKIEAQGFVGTGCHEPTSIISSAIGQKDMTVKSPSQNKTNVQINQSE